MSSTERVIFDNLLMLYFEAPIRLVEFESISSINLFDAACKIEESAFCIHWYGWIKVEIYLDVIRILVLHVVLLENVTNGGSV